ncbi:MFS transporter [Aestuariimicrobium sp. Y1814]|uniref:MFS transporter n=1 Tax=Aestuariimicrobium sp. Y1814 TaxID=3418742 RepID=UPI003DA74761
MTQTTPQAPPRLGGNYARLFSASALANLGDGLMAVAVVWLASALTRDPTAIALVGLASRLPWLLFSLPAGVLSDRYDRRLLVGAMDVVRCVVVAAFGLLLWFHQHDLPTPEALAAGAAPPPNANLLLGALVGGALLLGCAEVVRDNTAQSLLPSVVDRSLLEKANGRLWAAETTMNQFVGPPLAGVLVAVSVAWPFIGNAGLLAACAVLVFSLRGNFRPGGAASGRINFRAEISEGFRWLWGHHLLRALAVALGVMNLAGSLAGVVFVLFAQEVLGLFDGWKFGVLLSGAAAGAVIGSVLADRVIARLGEARALLVSITVMAVTLLFTAVVSSAALVWLAQLLSGAMVVVWNVITVSLRQRIIPDHLLGRVNSVYRFFGWGTISIGTLVGGLLVSWSQPWLGREWALRAPFVVGGALYLAVLVFAARRFTQDRIDHARSAAEAPVSG